MVAELPLPVLFEVRGAVAYVTLNRPAAANALSCELVGALGHAFARLRGRGERGSAAAPPEAEHREGGDGAAADREGGDGAAAANPGNDDECAGVRAVIVTGAGDKAFCAGADLKERRAMSLDETRSFLKHLNAVIDAVAACPLPVIAAINGAAFGGGLELALACDIRLAAAHAEVGLVETRLGIIPGAGGTQRLARVAGVAAAKELILTGRRITGARARELGLVSEVVAGGALAAAASRLADELTSAGPLAVAQAKRAIDGGLALPLAEGLAHERACYAVVLESEDRNEGLAAFSEKRPPKFTGR